MAATDTLKELKQVKQYILKTIRQYVSGPSQEANADISATQINGKNIPPFDPQFFINLGAYLQRLIDRDELNLEMDKYQVKAGRQLLCNIGIDLKHKIVPVRHYLFVFRCIRMSDWTIDARKLFWSAITEYNLYYRDAEYRQIRDYHVLIFAIKDLKHYVDEPGISTRDQRSHFYATVKEVHQRKPMKVACKILFKGEQCHFWVTTPEEINDMINKAKPAIYSTTAVVDQLGLSHLDFEKDDLGAVPLTTFKPNATLVDWSNPKTGYLSCFQKQVMGHTFSIQGYASFQTGIKERVFQKLEMSEMEVQNISIKFLDHSVIPPLMIAPDDIVLEGIRRFKKK
jgi:hypothetical protein